MDPATKNPNEGVVDCILPQEMETVIPKPRVEQGAGKASVDPVGPVLGEGKPQNVEGEVGDVEAETRTVRKAVVQHEMRGDGDKKCDHSKKHKLRLRNVAAMRLDDADDLIKMEEG